MEINKSGKRFHFLAEVIRDFCEKVHHFGFLQKYLGFENIYSN